MRKLLCILSMVVFCIYAEAQVIVKGTLTDSDTGEPLIGATVKIKGTTKGTTTDFDGKYTLSGVTENAVLIFSYLGYQTQETNVDNRSEIDLKLKESSNKLDDVVVIGYGKTTVKDATGAVAAVKAKDFHQGIISSPEQLIQGKVAGVQITSSSGEPGGPVNVRIRGLSSFRNNNNPLFVIDGVPTSGSEISAGATSIGRGSSTARNPLAFLNPNDIVSIDILKDASASAIYGARGANGVILITTKSGLGSTGGRKAALEYSSSFGVSRIAKTFDLLNRDEFLAGITRFGGNADNLDFGADTDWQSEIFKLGIVSDNNISYSRLLKSGSVRVSGSYLSHQGIVRKSGQERLTGRLNFDHKFLNDKLSVDVRLTASAINDEAAPISNDVGFEGDLLGAAYTANPTWPAYIGSQFVNTNLNPIAFSEYWLDRTETSKQLANITASYKILEELEAKVLYGYDRSESLRRQAASSLLNAGSDGISGNGKGAYNALERGIDLLSAYLSYERNFGKHKIDGVLGYEVTTYKFSGVDATAWGFSTSSTEEMFEQISNDVNALLGSAGGPFQQLYRDQDGTFANRILPTPLSNDPINGPTVFNARSLEIDSHNFKDAIQSVYFRANYNYDDKYLITATFRLDGSSRFGKANQYGFFPSFSAAWRASEEAFVPDIFSNLKLRLGYGSTGNQEIPHNLHIGRQRFEGLGINAGGNVGNPGVMQVSFERDDIRWEATRSSNIGIDFGIVDERLSGSIDFYNKRTDDMLIRVTAAQPAPNPFQWLNLPATVINKGYEVSLNYQVVDTDHVNWDVGVNLAYNENVVEGLGAIIIDTGVVRGQGLSGAFAQRIADGQPLGSFYIREFLGFDTNGLAVYNGDFQKFVGKSALPKHSLGLSTSFSVKRFTMSAYFTGQFGFYIYNNTANAFFSAGSLGNGRNVTLDAAYSGESNRNAPDASTRFLEKGDFLRLQTLSFSYDIDVSKNPVFKNLAFRSLALYVNFQNLFVITNYSGLDPEVDVQNALEDVPTIGLDYTSYPKARTVTLGFTAGF